MFKFLRKTTNFGTLTILICFKACFHKKVAKTLHIKYTPLHLYWPSQSVSGFVGLSLWCVLSPRSPKHVHRGTWHMILPPLILCGSSSFYYRILGTTFKFIWGAVKVISQERVALFFQHFPLVFMGNGKDDPIWNLSRSQYSL